MDREKLSTVKSGGSSRTRQEFFTGVRAVLPLLVGVSPFGMIYGVLARQAGIPVSAAQAMSSILFAGSAQFITAQLFSSAIPAVVLILTIAVVNLRHALYSASIAPFVKHLRPAWKAILSYLLTDEAYAVSILHYEDGADDGNKHWFFLGAGLGLWLIWQLSTAVGILLGAVIPPAWSLDFTLPLTFIAIVVPALKDRSAVVAALVAGVIAVLAFGLPYKLWLIVAALVGIAAGLLVEGRQ
jgi:4-azaleucine resistance transporter AzlC